MQVDAALRSGVRGSNKLRILDPMDARVGENGRSPGEASRCGGRDWVTARTDTVVGMDSGKWFKRCAEVSETGIERWRNPWSLLVGASFIGLEKWDVATHYGLQTGAWSRGLLPDLARQWTLSRAHQPRGCRIE